MIGGWLPGEGAPRRHAGRAGRGRARRGRRAEVRRQGRARGFTEATLATAHARAGAAGHATSRPFEGRQPPKGTIFVEPRLVARSWSSRSGPQAGTLRAPSFKGLREDVTRKRSRGGTRARAAMARAIWSGAISFGLVNIPVKLYSAVSKQDGALPPARLRGQHAHPAEAREPQHGRGGPLRAAGQGLRAQPRPLRGDHARGARLDRAARRRARSTSRTSSRSTRSTRSTTTTPTTSRRAPARPSPTRCCSRR